MAAAFSPSLLASTPVASQPHPERKTVLIEANALFLTDMLGMGTALQRAFRQGYSLDRAQHALHRGARHAATLVVLRRQKPLLHRQHRRAAAGRAAGRAGADGAAHAARPAQPVLGLHYSLAPLPDEPMARARGRRAHRLLHHNRAWTSATTSRARRASASSNRWRLEKKDPAAALSEPVKPITFWIDRNVPLKYRDADHRGHPRMEQGLREDRLQGRDRGQGAARRRRLRHARLRRRVGALDDQRAAGLRRHRPEPCRPAQRRDPRRRHRHREPVVAQRARARAQVLAGRARSTGCRCCRR